MTNFAHFYIACCISIPKASLDYKKYIYTNVMNLVIACNDASKYMKYGRIWVGFSKFVFIKVIF